MKFKMLENEYWYGGYVHDGIHMPIGPGDEKVIDLSYNQSPNQSMPFFVSSKGRYLWCDEGFKITFSDNIIETDRIVVFEEGYDTLKNAYIAGMKAHFPSNTIHLDNSLFEAPLYNTWIELTFNQNQKDILEYANNILENHMPPGVLIIDDGWSDYYGNWLFNKEKFPDPKKMIDELHDKGFKVMVWICPFITPDTTTFRYARNHDLLIETKENKPYIVEWWNGYSAVLDFSKEKTNKWFKEQLGTLISLGVDGFKFDAGDSFYYEDPTIKSDVSSDRHSFMWAKFGEQYSLNEYRVTFKAGGMSLLQRLCDKHHSWGYSGIKALIPNSLAQGITGHPFSSPDMIGGGEYLNFQKEASSRLDENLFIRHSEIACLMPCMQFSAAPWRVLSPESFNAIQSTINIRQKYLSYLLETIENSKVSGEPILRYMEYVFPHEGLEKVTNQFMLGEKLLVAPIENKGELSRLVHIPTGKWRLDDQIIIGDGCPKLLNTTLGVPIILERQ